MRIFNGNPVSRGIAVADAYLYKAFSCDVHEAYFEKGDEQKYLDRFMAAKQTADRELAAIAASFPEDQQEKAKIFEAHKEILFDEEIEECISEAISGDRCIPEYAVDRVFGEFIELLGKAKDPLIAARTADLRDVRNRLLRILQGEPEKNLSRLPGPVIVVAHDLLPSDTATLDRANVMGIVTEVGGATSHSAIIAKSYRIPALLGVPEITEIVTDGDLLALDATDGTLRINPDASTADDFRRRRKTYLADEREIALFRGREPLMADDFLVQIGINIGSSDPDEGYDDCDFVGLFRTEFLYMGSDHMPSEEEQLAAYKKVLIMAGKRPVTLRTLDIGGDKTLKYMQLPKEDNPFLGQRALRLCLANLPMFKVQLRAALRASVYGNLQIMLPMVGSIDDIRAAKAVIAEVKAELKAEGTAYNDAVPVGIMVEIPSIAMVADLAAREVDFASIGTNDLCQYLTAVDRMNARISGYYQSFSPAMLRVLGHIIREFTAAGKAVSICGELAGDPLASEVLAGLGLRKFSMSSSQIAPVKRALARRTLSEAEDTARRCCAMRTEAEVLEYLKRD